MRRAALARALASTAGAATTADPDHGEVDPARRHRPALRRGVGIRLGRSGREGVLRLRQRTGRRQRAEDRVPLLRRRLRPRADRAADAEARRAGQGLRNLQLGRHREQRDPALPEPTQGAAALRRRRLPGSSRPARYPWTMGFLQSYVGEGAVYGRTSPPPARARDRRPLRADAARHRHDDRARALDPRQGADRRREAGLRAHGHGRLLAGGAAEGLGPTR